MDRMSSNDLNQALDEADRAANDKQCLAGPSKGKPPDYMYKMGLPYPDDLDELGLLPPKWEKAYTEDNEAYFIDHNTSTSHWLDPRLAKNKRKTLEECEEDELPYGWERIDDPHYGTYYIDHVTRQTQYENPVLEAKYGKARSQNSQDLIRALNLDNANYGSNYYNPSEGSNFGSNRMENYAFTKDPNELAGTPVTSTLTKTYMGLGITMIGGEDVDDQFLQIKRITPLGPAWNEGVLQPGDVIAFVNGACVLGYSHNEMVRFFQNISAGETVTIEARRGYPFSYDANDPNTEVVTTMAVGNGSDGMRMYDNRGGNGDLFGETDGDYSRDAAFDNGRLSSNGYESRNVPSGDKSVKSMELYTEHAIPIVKGENGFGFTIADNTCGQKVKKILDRQRCHNLAEGDILIYINDIPVSTMNHAEVVQVLKNCPLQKTATIYVRRVHKGNDDPSLSPTITYDKNVYVKSGPGTNLSCNSDVFRPPSRGQSPGNVLDSVEGYGGMRKSSEGYKGDGGEGRGSSAKYGPYELDPLRVMGQFPGPPATTHQSFPHYDGAADEERQLYNPSGGNGYPLASPNQGGATAYYGYYTQMPPHASYIPPDGGRFVHGSGLVESFADMNMYQPQQYKEYSVTLRSTPYGFGFKIMGGKEEGTQVSVGRVVENGAADKEGSIRVGDEIRFVNKICVEDSSHHDVRYLMSKAAEMGSVDLVMRRNIFKTDRGDNNAFCTRDVYMTREMNEGFGFVLISSANKAGSNIGSIIAGSPADRCGQLRVNDHIIAVNDISILNKHHGEIVNMIKESGCSIILTIVVPADDSSGSASNHTFPRAEEVYEKLVAVEIKRSEEGFGFCIKGGRDTKESLMIRDISRNSPSYSHLQIGDRIVSINGEDGTSMTHVEALNKIRASGPYVRLTVRRSNSTLT